jgi:hypothetical protein
VLFRSIALVASCAILWLTPTQPRATVPASNVVPAPAPSAVDKRPSTEIVSAPAGAEITLRGALVANAPARITRPSYETLYLVRARGYRSQLVALSPHSPDVIHIELQPNQEAPLPSDLPAGLDKPEAKP